MCEEFRRRKVPGAPTSYATLSRWVRGARRAADLDGGYREAIAELLPEARRQADLERARPGRDFLARQSLGRTG
jgi:hypothetical protein